jgi:hypothetical protein
MQNKILCILIKSDRIIVKKVTTSTKYVFFGKQRYHIDTKSACLYKQGKELFRAIFFIQGNPEPQNVDTLYKGLET